MAGGVAFNHLGQCVTDLERSKRFYTELLAFEVEREIHPPDELSATLLQLTPPLGMTACYLRRDGLLDGGTDGDGTHAEGGRRTPELAVGR